MKVIVSVTSTPEDMQYMQSAVDSLQSGLQKPDHILITLATDRKYSIPNPLRKIPNVTINRIDNDYGPLTAIVGFIEEYPASADVYCLYLNGNCQYPRNLLREFTGSLAELNRILAEKLPNFKGSVYGLGGIVMVPDRQRVMDMEFDGLLKGEDTNFEKRSIIGYVKENATVDILESYGCVFFHRSQIGDDFMEYLKACKKTQADAGAVLCSDMILSNYFAKNTLMRTQMCTLNINRFMLDAAGFTEHRKHRDKPAKEEVLLRTAMALRKDKMFYLWD